MDGFVVSAGKFGRGLAEKDGGLLQDAAHDGSAFLLGLRSVSGHDAVFAYCFGLRKTSLFEQNEEGCVLRNPLRSLDLRCFLG